MDDSVTNELWTWGDESFGSPKRGISDTLTKKMAYGGPMLFGEVQDSGPNCAYDPKPDGPRYAQMGNAVTVNVAEWIGHRLREFG